MDAAHFLHERLAIELGSATTDRGNHSRGTVENDGRWQSGERLASAGDRPTPVERPRTIDRSVRQEPPTAGGARPTANYRLVVTNDARGTETRGVVRVLRLRFCRLILSVAYVKRPDVPDIE